MVLGSSIEKRRYECGSFPGRPDGSCVIKLVICHGFRSSLASLVVGAAKAADAAIKVMKDCANIVMRSESIVRRT